MLGIDDPRFARPQTTIDTDDAPGPKSMTLALEPARIIAGRVTDAETGQPIPHARLVVLAYKDGAGTPSEFEADDQGRFRVNPPSADHYSISASSAAGPALSEGLDGLHSRGPRGRSSIGSTWPCAGAW